MNLLEYLLEYDKSLFIETEKIKQEVATILINKLHLNYTDHSIEHSLRILEHLSQIMSELMVSDERLNKHELFILISSVYLHDIGMQFERFELLEKYEIKVKDEEKSDEELKLNFIRNHHHSISKIWIIESIIGNTDFRKVYFGDSELGELVALISESHNIDLKKNMSNYNDYIFHGTRIRLNLLACLIALGDALDADSRRVDIERLKHINIQEGSRLHWWKHYYISGLYYENGILNIQYNFPNLSQSELDIYYDYFSSETKYWLTYNKENFKSILSKNYIRFDFNETIIKSIVKQKLAEEDYKYIENYVLSSRMSPIEKIRQTLSQKLGYKYIEVTEDKSSYIILYKDGITKIVSVQKSQYETSDFQDTINKIINEIMR
ncbi:HD domain-containing protein [Clostridium peptidivorans]|uniref:HD domain-containing protein n=1 Tax=Clostridium peptidivorans TaxID=100174 RepID=UPI000BE2D55B|nr:HD domain-containing protein [Clostridium peptidivorans]